jgi:hypothetical protein
MDLKDHQLNNLPMVDVAKALETMEILSSRSSFVLLRPFFHLVRLAGSESILGILLGRRRTRNHFAMQNPSKISLRR